MAQWGPPVFQPYIQGPAGNLPGSNTWQDFNTLFNNNKQSMLDAGSNDDDIGHIWNAIMGGDNGSGGSVAGASNDIGVDPRLILVIIMQESNGNTGIGTPSDAGGNPTGGLMQCEESPAFPGLHSPQCTQQNVIDMVYAGTEHFKQSWDQAGGQWDDGQIYAAFRIYNSGQVNWDDLSNISFSTGDAGNATYVSDVMNRLQGQTD